MLSFILTVSAVLLFIAILRKIDEMWRRAWVSDITKKAVFITGCDSGFGRATSLSLDALGVPIFAGCFTKDGAESLKADASSRLRTVSLDVTQEDSVKKAYTYVMDNLPDDGTVLWGIINNAGVIDSTIPLDMITTQEFRRVYDVNVFGTVAVTLTFLPALKKSKGRVINTSSLAGVVPSAFLRNYGSSKYAVKGFNDCIRLELLRWGITVCLIMPGWFNTGIQSHIMKQFETMWNMKPDINKDYGPEYLEAEKKRAKEMDTSFASDISPVVESFKHALFAEHPKTHYLIGPFTTVLPFLTSYTPTWFTDWLILNTPGLKRPLPKILSVET